MATPNQVFFPSGMGELFSVWGHFPDAVPCAGGTGFVHGQGSRLPEFPQSVISLDGIEELKRVSRTERYLEIGAMVKLNQIINLGKIVPEALTRCLLFTADPQVRNQAAIGGAICFPPGNLDIHAPMTALDAQYELRAEHSSRWVSASRFSSPAEKELLTRVRVPLEPWTFTGYHKIGGKGDGAVLFIMKNEKNILTGIRVVCAGGTILRSKDSEATLLGKRLPIERKDADAFAESWKGCLSGTLAAEEDPRAGLARAQTLNFIRAMLRRISD
ncbi:MAG: FAD binding domain-containing protein [Treponema sp.]|nr:FAD binding domain-containing protein [Treponema sp.]